MAWIDQHPTHYNWTPMVRSWVYDWILYYYPRASANTYYDHPTGQMLDSTSADFWAYAGRGNPISYSLGQAIVDYVMSDPASWYLRWLIWYGWIWDDYNGWYRYSDPYDQHYDHVHMTFYNY